MTVDADPTALAAALDDAVAGDVRFDPGSRHLYATDASHYRQVPLGVVVPRDVDDVVAAVTLCVEHGAPITHRGAGTSLAGQATNEAVIIDSSRRLAAIADLDPERRTAHVEPGVVLDDLRAAARRHDLTFAPDPATHNRCTLGGMIGNNACGVHSIMGGKTVDNVEALDVLLTDGTRMEVGAVDADELDRIIAAGGRRGEVHARLRGLIDRHADAVRGRYPAIPRRVSGFNLDELLPERGFHVARALVGTEGTCVTVLGATLRLVDSPPHRRLVVLGYPTPFDAADDVLRLLDTGCIGLEGFDHHLVDRVRVDARRGRDLDLLPDGGGWLLAEYGGWTADEADAAAEAAIDAVSGTGAWPSVRTYDDPADAERIWALRKAALAVTTFVPGEPPKWSGWEDAAVAPAQLGGYLREFDRLLEEHGLTASLYGHFGDGCVHSRISFDFTTEQGVATYRRFVTEAAELCLDHGGSFSGEHGDGQARAELLPRMFGDDLVDAFGEFKAIWDPDGLMNPGKVVDPRRLDDDLRLGPTVEVDDPPTWFSYPDDEASFARAQLRCVGAGLCRRDDGAGTMCPSWMVTHEEQHSTRGRARLLHEMLRGDAELDGFDDEAVLGSLDLCLSCKGCKVDCPVNVDIATYKAEFLAHHHRDRARPLHHYATGLAGRWIRLAARTPGLANAAARIPVVGDAARRFFGITPHRDLPPLADRTFRSWFARHPAPPGERPEVALFVDTFTDALAPHIGRATVAALEDAGYRVTVPADACCGRPLYEVGMLDRARRQLEELVRTLSPIAERGVPIVAMEPSCLSVLRAELVEMLPDDSRARAIADRSRSLAEVIVATDGYRPPRLEAPAVVHGHCHQKADVGLDAEVALFDAMGLGWRELDAGCCGLAGAFGYGDGDRYEVSVAAGERKLIPAVRDADDDTLVITDGFSCRSQIDHLQDRRRALHTAEVLALARTGTGSRRPTDPIERATDASRVAQLTGRDGAAIAVGLGLVGAAAWLARRATR